jgi:hypothetical protein
VKEFSNFIIFEFYSIVKNSCYCYQDEIYMPIWNHHQTYHEIDNSQEAIKFFILIKIIQTNCTKTLIISNCTN